MNDDSSMVEGAQAANVLLRIRHLRMCFGKVPAVDDVSLDLARGRTLGLVGESGCGKTTLARSILRLVEPDEGLILFDGLDVRAAGRRLLRSFRRDVQAVFQDPAGSLNPRMRVGSIVAEPLDIHGVGDRRSRAARVAELLRQVGLRPDDADRFPHEFSGGQRQRIGIARAIALSPKMVILDEPVSALDVSVQAQVLNLLHDLKDALGLTYLFVAHNLAIVRHFSDTVAVMYRGKIVEFASTSELFVRPLHPYTMLLLAAVLEPQTAGPWRAPAPIEPAAASLPLRGCAFHARCPHAVDRCLREAPEPAALPGVPSTHLVACHRAEELAAPGGAKNSR